MRCVAALLTFAMRADAVEKQWTGAVDDQWSTAGNWNPSGVPSETDTVTINATEHGDVVRITSAPGRLVEVKSVIVGPGVAIQLNGGLQARTLNVSDGASCNVTREGDSILSDNINFAGSFRINCVIQAVEMTVSTPSVVSLMARGVLTGQDLNVAADLVINGAEETVRPSLVGLAGTAKVSGASVIINNAFIGPFGPGPMIRWIVSDGYVTVNAAHFTAEGKVTLGKGGRFNGTNPAELFTSVVSDGANSTLDFVIDGKPFNSVSGPVRLEKHSTDTWPQSFCFDRHPSR